MIEFPTAATFAAVAAEPRFIGAAAVAVLAGVVRGFSGFGSALIYVPLMSAIYEPRIATVSFVIPDYFSSAPYLVQAFRHCHWRAVLPAFLAAALAVPFGTMTQMSADPDLLRWGMAVFVALFVILLAAGWRYPGPTGTGGAIGAGMLSGFAGGATQMSGPPLILFWLGSSDPAAMIRANLMACLGLIGLLLCVSYIVQGLVTAQPIAIAVMLWPAYVLSVVAGARWFRGTSDRGYRRVGYAIIAASAVVSLPIFDTWLR